MDLNPVFVLEKGPWRPTCAFVLPTIPHHYPECGPHSLTAWFAGLLLIPLQCLIGVDRYHEGSAQSPG